MPSSQDDNIISHEIWSGFDAETSCNFCVTLIEHTKEDRFLLYVTCNTGQICTAETVESFNAEYTKEEIEKLMRDACMVEEVRKLYKEAEVNAKDYYGDTIH